jgi:hypothetical protein
MNTRFRKRTRITPELIKERIQRSAATELDKEILRVEFEVLMNEVQLPIQQVANWIAESIDLRESTLSEREEIGRAIDSASMNHL